MTFTLHPHLEKKIFIVDFPLCLAAVGNRTPQLHIHVIARYENDPARPLTVWDHKVRAPYDEEVKNRTIQRLRKLLGGYAPQASPPPDFP